MNLFSEGQRRDCFNSILENLQLDMRIIGVIRIGSGVIGYIDRFSDLDFCVIVNSENELEKASNEWKEKFERLLPVIEYMVIKREKSNFLHIMMLENFLEINMGFVVLDRLRALKNRWEVMYDRSGQIEDIMRSTWESKLQDDQTKLCSRYLKLLEVWYYFIHAMIAIKRQMPWRALDELDEIRKYIIALRGLRENLVTKRNREVDQMPVSFLNEVVLTLVDTPDLVKITIALKNALKCFYKEAEYFDQLLGIAYSFEWKCRLNEYCDLVLNESEESR